MAPPQGEAGPAGKRRPGKEDRGVCRFGTGRLDHDATHGYGPFRRLLIGSVTAKVLHDASCPVWTAAHTKDMASVIPGLPRRVACAVDLGPHSSNILSWASRLSWEFGASLGVIYVAASLDPRLQDYGLSPEWRGHVINEARAELARLLETGGAQGDIHVEIGPIVSGVAGAAKELRADLSSHRAKWS